MKHKMMIKLRNLLQSNKENLLKGELICCCEWNGNSLIFPVSAIAFVLEETEGRDNLKPIFSDICDCLDRVTGTPRKRQLTLNHFEGKKCLFGKSRIYNWSTHRRTKRTWGDREVHWGRWLDMSIPLKLFLVLNGNGSLFPQTSAWYLLPVDQGILKRWSAWKYVLPVEAPEEKWCIPQPLWNKNAGWKKYQSLYSENLNQRKQRWQQERIYLLSFV